MPGRNHFILLLMAGLAACGGDTSTTAEVPVWIEDSAGVRIVAHQGIPTAKTTFRIATEPLYRHGANPGDYTFQEVTVGLLLPDGSAAVYDPWNGELVVLGRDEATYEVLATEGEGGRGKSGAQWDQVVPCDGVAWGLMFSRQRAL